MSTAIAADGGLRLVYRAETCNRAEDVIHKFGHIFNGLRSVWFPVYVFETARFPIKSSSNMLYIYMYSLDTP